MCKSLAMKALTAVAVCVLLLGHLSPVTAGVLLCIGDGNDPDCCGERYDSQLLDGSDCSCCIAIDAAPSATRPSSHKASLDVVSGSILLRNVTLPTGTRIPGAPTGAAGETSLSSLRTVVLLI